MPDPQQYRLSKALAAHIGRLVIDDQLLTSITRVTLSEGMDTAPSMARATVDLILHPQDVAEIIAYAAGTGEVVMAAFRGTTRDEQPRTAYDTSEGAQIDPPGRTELVSWHHGVAYCALCSHSARSHGPDGCNAQNDVGIGQGVACTCVRTRATLGV